MWLRSSWTWTGVAASAFISGKSTPSHDGLYHRALLTSAVDALILNFFIHRKLLDLWEGIKPLTEIATECMPCLKVAIEDLKLSCHSQRHRS